MDENAEYETLIFILGFHSNEVNKRIKENVGFIKDSCKHGRKFRNISLVEDMSTIWSTTML